MVALSGMAPGASLAPDKVLSGGLLPALVSFLTAGGGGEWQ